MMLPKREIKERVTEGSESRPAVELQGMASMAAGGSALLEEEEVEKGEPVRERRIWPATAARIRTPEGGHARHGIQGWPARGVDEAVCGRGMGAACSERG